MYVGLIVMMPFLAPLLKHVAKRFPSPSSREVRLLYFLPTPGQAAGCQEAPLDVLLNVQSYDAVPTMRA